MYMDLRHKNIMLIHSLKRQINTELRENPIRANSDQYSNNFRPVFDQRVYKHTLGTDADTRQRTSSTSEITSFFFSELRGCQSLWLSLVNRVAEHGPLGTQRPNSETALDRACKHYWLTVQLYAHQWFSSVQFSSRWCLYTHKKPLCAPPRLSEVLPTPPLIADGPLSSFQERSCKMWENRNTA